MKMFQTRCVNQLLYSDLDACESGVRDETTRILVRKEWTHDQQRGSSQNPEHALQSSHQARLVERNTLRQLPCETLSSSGSTNPEDGPMEFGTSCVDTRLERGSREFE